MGIFDKIKDLGSRIIKPVIKPFNPARLPILRKLPPMTIKPIGGKDGINPALKPGYKPPDKPPKNILLSNGMALK